MFKCDKEKQKVKTFTSNYLQLFTTVPFSEETLPAIKLILPAGIIDSIPCGFHITYNKSVSKHEVSKKIHKMGEEGEQHVLSG